MKSSLKNHGYSLLSNVMAGVSFGLLVGAIFYLGFFLHKVIMCALIKHGFIQCTH